MVDVALWTDLEGLTIAGRYELRSHLATGGMAAVFRGWDHRMERPVAVKLLRDGNGVVGDADLERFRREARAVAALRSPHIVEVYDFITDDERNYLIMELVDGLNLKQRIWHTGPLPVDEALTYAIHVCRALTQTHAHGYIHRDIKPQNILLPPSGVTKLTDFGIVHVGGGPSLTASGLVLGTADYIAPEQAQGLALGPTSDLYSLGVVLFEMLTATVPFTGSSATAVAVRHTTDPLPSLRSRNPNVPPLIERIVRRATTKDAAQRFASACQMEAALTYALTTLGANTQHAPRVDAPVPSLPRRRVVAVSGTARREAPKHAPEMPTLPVITGDTDDPDELDWHDVALLLSASWPHGTASAPDESPEQVLSSILSPPEAGPVAAPAPAARGGALLLSEGAGRLAWTLIVAVLLLIAIIVLRMLP
jgi:serine/threonine protein kinase